jgi:hypothetical protein
LHGSRRETGRVLHPCTAGLRHIRASRVDRYSKPGRHMSTCATVSKPGEGHLLPTVGARHIEDLADFYFFTTIVEHGGIAAASRILALPKSRLSGPLLRPARPPLVTGLHGYAAGPGLLRALQGDAGALASRACAHHRRPDPSRGILARQRLRDARHSLARAPLAEVSSSLSGSRGRARRRRPVSRSRARSTIPT